MSKKTNPIAVFDSGVGGISVLRELVKILPNEDYIYYGDSKNAPYGMKDKETVKQLTINAAEYLFAQGHDFVISYTLKRSAEDFKRLVWEESGWTQPAPQLPGLEILLPDVESFAQNVMCQHYIISYGDNTELIKNLCDILGIQVIE